MSKAQLHEVLAVEGDLKGTYEKVIKEAIHTFTKKASHFTAVYKELKMIDEKYAAAGNIVESDTKITEVVGSKLKYALTPAAKYYDAVLQKEATNQTSKADLVVDGKEIAKDVPATFLLGLETKLKQIRDLFESIPTLAPDKKWELDTSVGEGVYKSAIDDEVFKTQKTFKAVVMYPATSEHPAQVEKVDETINIGRYITQYWSSMISPAEKSKYLMKIDKLIRATKRARQKANREEVVSVKIGKSIVDYLLS